jgi:hypothetical protein
MRKFIVVLGLLIAAGTSFAQEPAVSSQLNVWTAPQRFKRPLDLDCRVLSIEPLSAAGRAKVGCDSASNALKISINGGAFATFGGSGTVTTLGTGTIASIFTFSVTNPATTPAISLSFSAQLANCILAGPVSGSAAAPTCRALDPLDIPTLAPAKITGTAVIATDSRLSDSRTPTGHASTHAAAGSDPVTLIEAQTTNLLADLAAKAATTRLISTTSPLNGGGDLSANRTLTVDAAGSGVAGVIPSTGVTGGMISTGAVTDDKTSLAVKPSCGVVATSNITLTGVQTIDGVGGSAGTTLVLATAQTTGSQNGPWTMQSGAWTRPAWYPSGGTTQAFQFITTFVRLGNTFSGTTWRITSAGAVTIDTTATTWQEAQLHLDAASTTGSAPTAVALASTPTACSAGSYARGIDVNGNAVNCTAVPAPFSVSGTGVPTVTSGVLDSAATPFTPNATASTIASRDSSANMRSNSYIDGYTTTATAAGTTTLTVASTKLQLFTGSTTQTVVLPVASTLVTGQEYRIINLSTGTVTVNSSGANLVLSMPANAVAHFMCILTSGTSAASWSAVPLARTDNVSQNFAGPITFSNSGTYSMSPGNLAVAGSVSGNTFDISGALHAQAGRVELGTDVSLVWNKTSANQATLASAMQGGEKDLTNNTATGFVKIGLATDTVAAGKIVYTVRVLDATNHLMQVTSGTIPFSAINENGTVTISSLSAVNTSATLHAASSDAISFDSTSTSTDFTVRVTSNTSLTATTHVINYIVLLPGNRTITHL